jgi:hypothetical protein
LKKVGRTDEKWAELFSAAPKVGRKFSAGRNDQKVEISARGRPHDDTVGRNDQKVAIRHRRKSFLRNRHGKFGSI